MKLAAVPTIPINTALEALRKDGDAYKVDQNGEYLHWEELRRRPARSAISHTEWWGIVKLARRSLYRRLPLTDENGRPFSFSMTDQIQRWVHQVDREASGRIELPEHVTNPAIRDRYIVSSLIEESFRSSQLEGASTTRAVAKEMIRTKREPRTISERMIMNNFWAMEWVREHRNDDLTVEMLLELHGIVTKDTLEAPDGGGRLRRPDEPVQVVDPKDDEVVHIPPRADLLPERIVKLCAFANGGVDDEGAFLHPVARSILVHFWLAYDHPFVDGNGRTARALFYWSMLRHGYWLTEFISISRVIKKARSQYDRAFLFTETDDNDSTYFLLNQLKVLRQAIADLSSYLRKKAQEVREVEERMRGRDDLNNRQLAVLSYALRNPAARITIDGHQLSHRVVYQTARTDLLGLVDRGYLEQGKSGRKLIFTPVRDLERRLKPTR